MRSEEVTAALAWLEAAEADQVKSELRLILQTSEPTTATERIDSQLLAELLVRSLHLPIGQAAEIAALRSRIAALEKLVPAGVMLELPVRDAMPEIGKPALDAFCRAASGRPYQSSFQQFDGQQTVIFFKLWDGSTVNSRDNPEEAKRLLDETWFAKGLRAGEFRREHPAGAPSDPQQPETPSRADRSDLQHRPPAGTAPSTAPHVCPRCASPSPASPPAAAEAVPAAQTTAPEGERVSL